MPSVTAFWDEGRRGYYLEKGSQRLYLTGHGAEAGADVITKILEGLAEGQVGVETVTFTVPELPGSP